MPISLNSISYAYSSRTGTAIDNLSLEIKNGEFIGLTGPEGSGKTTLLSLIAGLIKPRSGEIYIDGEETDTKKSGLHNNIAFLPQDTDSQFFQPTAERELMFSLRGSAMGKEEKNLVIGETFSFLGLDYEAIKDKNSKSLSAGERKLTALAAALLKKPAYLLMDEPFNRLDDREKNRLADVLTRLNTRGMTIVLATADSNILSRRAERVIVLEEGKILRDGGTKDVFTDYFDLVRHGVNVPDVVECIELLRENGMNMPRNIIDYGQFLDRLKVLIWSKEK